MRPIAAACWRATIGVMTARGEIPKRTIEPEKLVRCRDCRHGQATSHAMIYQCGAERMAPAPAGWWGVNSHVCEQFKGKS
ncbi:hypothetical protein [Candidatus Methylospira mobilis]|uniref:hypothetical protein n=1 Tax=Candidatus Methylospira mobilis TaxID=1808979 RepID=UPI001D17B368|nr:hypothetical protein [Candidatus Methylospira mobilis]